MCLLSSEYFFSSNRLGRGAFNQKLGVFGVTLLIVNFCAVSVLNCAKLLCSSVIFLSFSIVQFIKNSLFLPSFVVPIGSLTMHCRRKLIIFKFRESSRVMSKTFLLDRDTTSQYAHIIVFVFEHAFLNWFNFLAIATWTVCKTFYTFPV